MKKIIENLLKIANALDSAGLITEAAEIDIVIDKLASTAVQDSRLKLDLLRKEFQEIENAKPNSDPAELMEKLDDLQKQLDLEFKVKPQEIFQEIGALQRAIIDAREDTQEANDFYKNLSS